jgi:integrase
MLDIPHATWRDHFARLDGAFAPSTLRAYYADVEHFETWCLTHAVLAFPVTVLDLCRYLEADGRCSSPATVRRRLYAIRKVHRLLRLPDPTLDEDINIALRKIKRAKLSRPKQAKGLTADYLDQFIAVQPETPWGWRNRAMLSLGYDVLTRRSELVALQTSDVALRRDGTLRVTVRRSKADPFGMGPFPVERHHFPDDLVKGAHLCIGNRGRHSVGERVAGRGRLTGSGLRARALAGIPAIGFDLCGRRHQVTTSASSMASTASGRDFRVP